MYRQELRERLGGDAEAARGERASVHNLINHQADAAALVAWDYLVFENSRVASALAPCHPLTQVGEAVSNRSALSQKPTAVVGPDWVPEAMDAAFK